MRELPCARHSQNKELHDGPSDDARIGALALIAELRLPFPLKDLFALDIQQPVLQILDSLHQIVHLSLVCSLYLACSTNRQIEVKLHVGLGEPAAPCVGLQAQSMLAALCRREGEATVGVAFLVDDAMVIVKDLLHCDLDARVGVVGVGRRVWVPFLCSVRAHHQRVLGQLLEETLLLRPFQVEVERGCTRQEESRNGQQSHLVYFLITTNQGLGNKHLGYLTRNQDWEKVRRKGGK